MATLCLWWLLIATSRLRRRCTSASMAMLMTDYVIAFDSFCFEAVAGERQRHKTLAIYWLMMIFSLRAYGFIIILISRQRLQALFERCCARTALPRNMPPPSLQRRTRSRRIRWPLMAMLSLHFMLVASQQQRHKVSKYYRLPPPRASLKVTRLDFTSSLDSILFLLIYHIWYAFLLFGLLQNTVCFAFINIY